MHTEGTYDVSGQVLLLPIRGTGRFLGNFSELNSLMNIHFWRLTSYSMQSSVNCFVSFLYKIADCTGNVRLQFTRKQTSQGDSVQIKKFQIKIKVGKGSVKLFNLFNGDKALGKLLRMGILLVSLLFTFFCRYLCAGDAVNSVINQNFDVVSKDIIPLVEKALQRKLKLIATKITQNFSYDQVFPL